MTKLASFVLLTHLLCAMNPLWATSVKEIETRLSDSVMTTKITTKFTENKLLNPLKISVSTHHGIVKLSGYVKDKRAFVEALRLTKATKGVHSVDADNLEIKPVNTPFTDAWITAKVEAAVLKAKVLDNESIPLVGISATTTNGIVTLTGHVKDSQSIAAILKRANEVHGVKKIISRLTRFNNGEDASSSRTK